MLIAFALALSGVACGGDDEDSGLEVVPAAGDLTPSADTPGVPPGSSYDLTGNEWVELDDLERFEAAQDFVADNPDACESPDGSAAADPVRDYADSAIGTDYPFNAPMAELLAEGCAAALQSGEQNLQTQPPASGVG